MSQGVGELVATSRVPFAAVPDNPTYVPKPTDLIVHALPVKSKIHCDDIKNQLWRGGLTNETRDTHPLVRSSVIWISDDWRKMFSKGSVMVSDTDASAAH